MRGGLFLPASPFSSFQQTNTDLVLFSYRILFIDLSLFFGILHFLKLLSTFNVEGTYCYLDLQHVSCRGSLLVDPAINFSFGPAAHSVRFPVFLIIMTFTVSLFAKYLTNLKVRQFLETWTIRPTRVRASDRDRQRRRS